ncbi:DnaD domain protein [Megamonas hypermegale]|uniref:DnaD domain protein n=1 Tax=Megamonas hypermegale TaxID=158847 RepID=UPI0026EB1880|nr:DnaD domain protein [Megamonas hypermegale]
MKEGEKHTDKKEVEKIIQGHFIRYFFDFYSLDLNSDEIHVLNIICSFEFDNKTYTGSQKYLCTLLKISKPRALRILNQLTGKGYLIKEASKGKQSSIYKINFTFLKEQLLNSRKIRQLTNDNKDVNYREIPQLDTETNCNDLLQSKSQNCNDLLHQLSQNVTVNCNKTLHNKNNNKKNNKNNSSSIATTIQNQSNELEDICNMYAREIIKEVCCSPLEAEGLKKLVAEYGADKVKEAIEISVERNKKSLGYIKGILKNKEAAGNSQPLNTLSKSDKTVCLPAKDEW